MAWTWKSDLKTAVAVERTKNEHLQAEIVRLNSYITKCENLIDHERQRVTDERERADRVNDSLLQQNGLPASTATVRAEQAQENDKLKDVFDQQMKDMQEIYGETVEEMTGESSTDVLQDFRAAVQ